MKTYSFKFFATAVGAHGTVSARTVAAGLGYTGTISLLSVMTLPRPPVLVSPLGTAGGGGIPIQNVQLSWRDPGIPNYNQATKCHVTLSPGNFVSDVVSPSTNVAVNKVLFFGTNYDWTAQAFNDYGASAVSSANFRTLDPLPPTNLSPKGEINVLVPLTLTWIDSGAQMGSPALQFEIQLSGTFGSGTTSPQRFVVQQANFTVPIALLPAHPYSWQVRSQYPPAGSQSGLSIPTSAQFQTIPQ
jgi:hypothetical protein